MSETLQPQFHPEIEKALETSGEDIGRVKDVELAQHWANAREAAYSGVPAGEQLSDERDKEIMSENLRHDITKRAVKKAADSQLLQNITTVATGTEPRLWESPEEYTQALVDEGKAVADDYNRVEEMAEVARQNREKQ